MINVHESKQFINLILYNSQRFVQKPKVVQISRDAIKNLEYTPTSDTFVSKTPKLTSKIAPLNKKGKNWDGIAKLQDGTKIGNYNCEINEHSGFKSKKYPASWFDSKFSSSNKYLHVNWMDTQWAEHQGYGREMMKRFYITSVESGCKGKIGLESMPDSVGFYKELGFEHGENDTKTIYLNKIEEAQKYLESLNRRKADGENISSACIRSIINKIEILQQYAENCLQQLFFTPTPENIAKLFRK
ncbi:MAG: GNAT family N-acetyltransferase [Cyanobacteria bacterium SIG28]|nr:GNAT family N-acetyltransferase [Cyanobacteria bacterium SIG28]